MTAPDAVSSPAIDWLVDNGVTAGAPVGLAVAADVGFGVACLSTQAVAPATTTGQGFADVAPWNAIADIEAQLSPRWVFWDGLTADALAAHDIGVQRSWDIVVVDQLLHGGQARSVEEIWSARHGLDPSLAPLLGQLDLLTVSALASQQSKPRTIGDDQPGNDQPGEHQRGEQRGHVVDEDVRAYLSNGYLKPGWVDGGFARSTGTLTHWAELALREYQAQDAEIARVQPPQLPARLLSTARVESAAAVLSCELGVHGLPFSVDAAEQIIEASAGPRPHDIVHEHELRAARDRVVLDLAPPGRSWDLRSPADVKQLLRSIELDLPDTRAWRLKEHIDHHPLVPALVHWRKAERLSNTYGYRWLDEHVSDNRLRGTWSPSDGAAGRMTASSGLHNLPAELRPAVVAGPAHVFVRADLGQIEPRVLAAMSGDEALVAATADDDLYTTIGRRLRVERDVAKLALLGAMYGSTTGEAANALRRLGEAYPAALNLLEQAAQRGRDGETVYTSGGRPVHMWNDDADGDIDRARRVAAARGRFARNAVVQGSAAEFFKMWAVTVRVRARPIDGEVVLCLHDELLLHVPEAYAAEGMRVVLDALDEVATRWSPTPGVRFVADASIVTCWADAK